MGTLGRGTLAIMMHAKVLHFWFPTLRTLTKRECPFALRLWVLTKKPKKVIQRTIFPKTFSPTNCPFALEWWISYTCRNCWQIALWDWNVNNIALDSLNTYRSYTEELLCGSPILNKWQSTSSAGANSGLLSSDKQYMELRIKQKLR